MIVLLMMIKYIYEPYFGDRGVPADNEIYVFHFVPFKTKKNRLITILTWPTKIIINVDNK